MFRKVALLTALTLIFSLSQCFAQDAAPVYDKDEKNFVTTFNSTVKNMKGMFTLDTQIYFLWDWKGSDYYKSQALPQSENITFFFVKDDPQCLEELLIEADDAASLSKALKPTLLLLGFDGAEADSINLEKSKTTVWCKATQRNFVFEQSTDNGELRLAITAYK